MSLRPTVFLGFPDHISKPYTTVFSPGTVPAELPLTNLQTDEPSEVTRLTSQISPDKTQFGFYFAGTEVSIDGFSLVNHNLTAGNQYRFVGFSNTTTSWTYQQAIPNAIAASTNASGVVGNIDEALDSPDGLVIEPTTKSLPMVVRLGFPTFSFAPDLSDYGAAFVIRAQLKWVGAGATNPTTLPTIEVKLREQGSPTSQALGSRVIQQDTAGGQILIFPFSFAQLAAPSGVDLEVEITTIPGDSPSGSSYGAIEVVRVYYDTDITALSGYLSATPWLSVIGYDEELASNAHDHYFPVKPTRVENGQIVPDYDIGDPETWTGIRSLILLVRTDQTGSSVERTVVAPLLTYTVRDPASVSGDGSVPYAGLNLPESWLDIGIVEAGAARFLTYGILPPGPLTSPHSEQSGESSISGQSYSVDNFHQSVSEPMTLQVTRGEAQWLQKEIGQKKGLSSPFYIAMEPDLDPALQQLTSGWMTLADDLGAPRKVGAYSPDENMMMEMAIKLREKL